MVATVGSISIDLSTNASKFASGFKSAASTVDREGRRMSATVGGIERSLISAQTSFKNFAVGFAGGIVAGLGVNSIVSALGKARDAIAEFDDIATRSRAVGLPTDTFQALGFAAKQANIEQEQLNGALEVFARNVGLAEKGTGALFTGLQRLNPELLRSVLGAKDQETRLKLVADAMRRLKSETDKAALSGVVFGKANSELARLLEGGAQSIDKMKENAKELGIIIPDDLLQRAGELDDKLDTLQAVTLVNFKQALFNLAPFIVDVSQGIASTAKSVNEFSAALSSFANNPSWAAFSELRQQLITLDTIPGTLADDIRNAFQGTAGSAEELQKEIAAVEQGIADTKKGIEELKAAGAVDFELTAAEQGLKSLENQLATLKAKAAEPKPVDIDTNEALAKLTALSAAASAVGSAMKAAFASTGKGKLPTVTRLNQQIPALDDIESETVTPTGPTLRQIDVDEILQGYASGGFTGHSPTDQIAGVVHGGEYVMDAETTRRLGVGNLDAIRRGVSGYESGGGVITGIPSVSPDQRLAFDEVSSNTAEALDELRTANEYLLTIEDDNRAMLASLQAIQSEIGSLRPAYSGGGSDAPGGAVAGFGGGSTMGLGFASADDDGERIRYNMSPYHAYPGHISFATGGTITAGDTQKVEFYKSPNESVEVLKPGQQSRYGGTTIGDIHIHVTGDIGSRQSQLAMRDELRRAVQGTARV